MGKMILTVFLSLVFIVAGASVSFTHQAGGVEIGDLETGSVVGTPFKELAVDGELFALEIGNAKVWYPPVTVVDFKSRTGRPVVLKVTNSSTAEHGFFLTADSEFAAPTVLTVKLVLKPGETKYIGIPTSDLFYATSANTFVYKCHLHPGHIGGKFVALGR
ncbi:MAG: hypothetical protein E6K69_10385 [Nitrospirae bacterium]|nr:MAG: hypothetical protein E6K69_10385 [Nitrospirota bacterium]